MKYPHRFIFYFCAIHYLKGKKLNEFNELIKNNPINNDTQFLKLFFKYIDIELFKDKPAFLDDILVYNHFKYEDIKKKSNLLKKYENEIVTPQLASDKKILKNLSKWGTYYLMTKS